VCLRGAGVAPVKQRVSDERLAEVFGRHGGTMLGDVEAAAIMLDLRDLRILRRCVCGKAAASAREVLASTFQDTLLDHGGVEVEVLAVLIADECLRQMKWARSEGMDGDRGKPYEVSPAPKGFKP
jgi:hypothetical protein